MADGTNVRVETFDVGTLSHDTKFDDESARRLLFDRITKTENREIMLIGLSSGGFIAIAIQSSLPDSLMTRLHKTLSRSASAQFSRKRPGLFMVSLSGIQGEQLISVASQDTDPNLPPTALAIEASRLLGSADRSHLMGITYLAESSLSPVSDGIVEAGGAAYHFPNTESTFWSQSLQGLFSPRT